MASHATTINAVPASEGRQQGMYSSTGVALSTQAYVPRRCFFAKIFDEARFLCALASRFHADVVEW